MRGKDVPTSDADDGRRYALRLHNGASTSDAGDPDGGRLMHVLLGYMRWPQNPEVQPYGG